VNFSGFIEMATIHGESSQTGPMNQGGNLKALAALLRRSALVASGISCSSIASNSGVGMPGSLNL